MADLRNEIDDDFDLATLLAMLMGGAR